MSKRRVSLRIPSQKRRRVAAQKRSLKEPRSSWLSKRELCFSHTRRIILTSLRMTLEHLQKKTLVHWIRQSSIWKSYCLSEYSSVLLSSTSMFSVKKRVKVWNIICTPISSTPWTKFPDFSQRISLPLSVKMKSLTEWNARSQTTRPSARKSNSADARPRVKSPRHMRLAWSVWTWSYSKMEQNFVWITTTKIRLVGIIRWTQSFLFTIRESTTVMSSQVYPRASHTAWIWKRIP